jgi:hypothetical protein
MLCAVNFRIMIMNLKFAYRGTKLPTDDMVFFMSQNKESESMDELERDMYSDMVRDNFFDRFSEELSDLSYMEMLDVLEMAKERVF